MKTLLEKLAAGIQYILPQHALTALVYRLMRVQTRWIKNLLIRLISSLAGVNWSEAASADLNDYRHFNEFFTRQLKPDSRPIDENPAVLVSPCDGRISEHGEIDGNRIFQAKGHHYSITDLLAGDEQCDEWLNGHFWTIYLSPRDYHRVHMPLGGTLNRMTYVPGRLFSVAPYTVRQVPGLFARNERVISVFDTAHGPVAQVLVGAMLVSSVAIVWDGEITPNRSKNVYTRHYQDRSLSYSRGEEMGRFNMGSTVILLVPPGSVTACRDLGPGQGIKLGEALAELVPGDRDVTGSQVTMR